MRRLAFAELRRQPGRFVAAGLTLTLLAVLLVFLGGLLDGLIRNATGAYRAQQAAVFVYSAGADDSIVRSRVPADVRATVAAVPGVTEVGGLGQVQLGARLPDAGPRELLDVAVFGYELPSAGLPEPPGAGEAYGDEVLKADGVDVGTVLQVGPARTPITIVGFVSDTVYAGQASLWATPDTWRQVTEANRPDTQLAAGTFQALVVRGEGDAAELARAIDAATGGATSSLAAPAAIDALPGVSDQRTVFTQILGVTVLVAAIVVGLFFALLTVERTSLYGALKAMGSRSSLLVAATILQAVVVTLVAAVIGGLLATLADLAIPPGSIPYIVTPGRLVLSVVLLVAAAVLGSAASLRRILRIDPGTAIGSVQ